MSHLHLLPRSLLYFAKETTPGTDPLALALSGSELIEVYDLTTDPAGLETIFRDTMKANISPPRGLAGKKMKTITFKVPLWTSAAAGSVPRWTDLMQACSMSINTTTNVSTLSMSSLQPYNASGPYSMTLYAVSNAYASGGTYEKLTGCVGDAKIVMENHTHPYIEFTFTGFYTDPGPVSALTITAGTPEVIEELAFQANTFTMQEGGSLAVQLAPSSKMEISLNNKIEPREDFTTSSGYANFVITGRETMVTVDIERDTPDIVQNDNLWEAWKAGGNYLNAVLACHNSRITLTGTAGTIKDLARGDKSGFEAYDLGLQLHGDDDELSIVVDHS